MPRRPGTDPFVAGAPSVQSRLMPLAATPSVAPSVPAPAPSSTVNTGPAEAHPTTMLATLGPEGTYSHRAALELDDDVRFEDSVPAIAEAVVEGDVPAGVLPIENAIEGSVDATLDVLLDHDVAITGEVVLPIHHALIGQREEIEAVASHPQALAQCRDYLRDHHPDADLRSAASTAAGVEAARQDPSVAAIAHPAMADPATDGDAEDAGGHGRTGSGEGDEPGAAGGRGLAVLAEEIADVPGNATRFVRLATEPLDADALADDAKTTIAVYPGGDRPGLLYDILGIFADRGINLTRIESRPSKRELGDYVFHLDYVDGDVDAVLAALREEVEWVEYCGTYERLA